MPVCVHCNNLAEHVYTVYSSRDNIRLAVCNQCGLFVDPLVEHPLVLLLIDVILLKPRVYRHLVFNYGSEPLQAGRKAVVSGDHEVLEASAVDGRLLGKESNEVDEGTRVATANHDRSKLITSIDVATAAQHLATTVIAAGFLKFRNPTWLLSRKEKLAIIVRGNGNKTSVDPATRRDRLTWPSVDAQVGYGGMAKTRDGRGTGSDLAIEMVHQSGTSHVLRSFEETVVSRLAHVAKLLPPTLMVELQLFWEALSHAMKREEIDEMWIAVRLLAGMSSGFGLRGMHITSYPLVANWLMVNVFAD
ncbi:hypothetical protein QFC22_000147 [Naganishia vaughanmartiniae]|uniref:Uncharacterized protein n=1 Tax=Naganishia vaughanmartiniae TaxID=1424756 RepID=A0ACC2XNI7_9TREE|nr:hypothetical protein QFC22_000147 [Naganishia vaughanmartiniae]